MSLFKKIILASLASVALAAGAHAADAVTYPAAAAAAPVPVYNDAQFDWNRFYAGISAGAQDYAGNWEYGGGIQAGVNAQFDFYLLGAEVAILGLSDGTNSRTYGQILGRGGLVVTDDIVLYGATGYGVDLSAAPDEHWLLGGGAEFAVTDNISLRGQYLHGFASTGASTDMNQVTFGLNYHF